jgi:hypothetical protein
MMLQRCETGPRIRRDGYSQTHYKGKSWLTHRLVMARERGFDAIEGMNVNHTCDNRACINPEHLYIGTQLENVRDMFERGRWRPSGGSPPGEANHEAKLTEEDVRAIRAAVDQTQRQLAEQYGVNQSAISRIVSRRSWRHL